MDCFAGARLGLLSSFRKEKAPTIDAHLPYPAAGLLRQARPPASLKNQDVKVFGLSHRISTALGAEWRPGILACRQIYSSTSSERMSENQVLPPISSSDDSDSADCTARNGSRQATTQPPDRITLNSAVRRETSTESSSISTAITSDRKQVVHSRDTSRVNDVSLTSFDTTESSESDDQKEKDPLPESLTDEMKKPGPLKEIQDRVSGNIDSSPSSDSDSSLSHLLASRNVIEFISRFPSWADSQKEGGMPKRQRRSFYSNEDWLRHRSSLRYIRHMLSSVSSRVIVSLVPPVFTFTSIAVCVAVYNTALKYGFLPMFLPILHAASLPYELTAPALALLLVFRTDASYSRYNEAKNTWTSILSSTKDLARLSAQLIRNPQDSELKASLLSYILAFPVSLKCHLIDGSDTLSELERMIQPYDLAFVLSSEHRPNCLIQLISQTLVLLHLEDTDRVMLENHVQQYVKGVSVCERLIFTPIPLSYTRLTSRFLVLWHMTLPFVLWDKCDWLVIPATFFSASTLFCIEEVGVLIEEPFPMLALDNMIGLAHDSIQELLKRQQDTDRFLSMKKEVAKQK